MTFFYDFISVNDYLEFQIKQQASKQRIFNHKEHKEHEELFYSKSITKIKLREPCVLRGKKHK